MFVTAPMSKPPALRPIANNLPGFVNRSRIRYSAQAMKSVNVFFFFSSLPSSYHWRPSSCPPRIWAMAYTNPRSIKLRRGEANAGSMLRP